MRDRKALQEMQAAPLSVKVSMTKRRIRDWVNYYGEENVFISFSGGKDSTVLLHIAREMYPDMKAVFSDTGLEFPEIREFVKTFDNVDWIKPKMNFREVINKYGYPFVSKEVSESVYGARKYLTQLIEQEKIFETDRQTDRQTEPPYGYYYRKLTGTGEYAKSNCNDTRGADNKFRKLRGIGEYSKRTNDKQIRRCESKISDPIGDADKGQESSDSGEYP